jgi:hypothetical protein
MSSMCSPLLISTLKLRGTGRGTTAGRPRPPLLWIMNKIKCARTYERNGHSASALSLPAAQLSFSHPLACARRPVCGSLAYLPEGGWCGIRDSNASSRTLLLIPRQYRTIMLESCKLRNRRMLCEQSFLLINTLLVCTNSQTRAA